ncbi:sucrose transport protein SUC3 isoform X1 [Jatropha curcas]|uniref:sucrose transport protein SUC3 isoform X1 n=1 Tax=Jatropha curcas TaxID=180498 RepID=UPI0005FB3D75|nr:sucrose transport protein SUC3 isoform X1 [Jatropha curcas]
MDTGSIRVPYRNLKKEVEVEMIGVEEQHNHRIHLDSPSSSSSLNSTSQMPNGHSSFSSPIEVRSKHYSLITLILSCTVAAGVQFGWALQLSLLTPYIQVQPCVGIWSDKCSSKFGRRRPFILAGSLMISVAVIIIGFSADIGSILGDTKEHCRTFKGTRTRAAFVFILGFWLLDLANNTVQGPARALLADLSGPDQRNSANAVFCSWMAVGNILGFSAGASGSWNRWFPFLMSKACCEACGNLKAAFLVAVVFLTLCTLVTLYFAEEVPLIKNQGHHLSDSAPLLDDNSLELPKSKLDMPVSSNSNWENIKNDRENISNGLEPNMNSKHTIANSNEDQNESFGDGPGAVLVNLLTSLRHLPPGMHSVLVVMALTWLSWFPFFLFDTDWMGREVYHGDPKGDSDKVKLYDQGVRDGAFGLLLNSVVLGISSFLIEPMCQRIGPRLVWAMSNFIVFASMAVTAIISLISVGQYSGGIEHVIGGSASIRIAALIVFALLGFPLAVTYSVPFSVTAELTANSGGGQGLAIGVLNLAIVIPQMIISLGAGPWDALFGGGNIPAFVLASVCALAAGVIATLKLPNLSNSSFKSSGFHIG